jgi:hypothetical protein
VKELFKGGDLRAMPIQAQLQRAHNMRSFLVHELFRRQGIGTALYDRAVCVARRHRKMSLVFTVRKENLGALAFYVGRGAHAYYNDGEDYHMAEVLDLLDEEMIARAIQQRNRETSAHVKAMMGAVSQRDGKARMATRKGGGK